MPCTQFYSTVCGHLLIQGFPPTDWQLLSGLECAWYVCVRRIWHGVWPCDVGIQWVPKHEVSFVDKQRKGLPQERYPGATAGGRRRGPLRQFLTPSITLSYFFNLCACVRACVWVCVNLIVRFTWHFCLQESMSSRIHYPPWCWCYRTVFTIYFTKYEHHASQKGSLSLRSYSHSSFFIVCGSSFVSLPFTSRTALYPTISLFDFWVCLVQFLP